MIEVKEIRGEALALTPMTAPVRVGVKGLEREVGVFNLEQLKTHVPGDWNLWWAASDFFYHGGQQIRLFPVET